MEAEVIERFWSKVDKSGDCWLWTGCIAARGYGSFYVNGRSRGAHRIAYEICYGPILPIVLVCHHCDNPRCVNPSHLFLGTWQDNMTDMVRKDRHSAAGRKLSAAQVLAIRRAYASGKTTMSELSRNYALRLSTIEAIINRHTWKHLPQEEVHTPVGEERRRIGKVGAAEYRSRNKAHTGERR